MNGDAIELDTYIGAASSMLGIDIDPSWIEPIRFHLLISLRMASMVSEFPLPDEAEPAPVFSA